MNLSIPLLIIFYFFTKFSTNFAIYEWQLTNSIKNVQTYCKFVADIYKNYFENSQENSAHQISFSAAFVKFAFECVEHRAKISIGFSYVLSQNAKAMTANDAFEKILLAFEKNIFYSKKPLPSIVRNQLMRLTFSLAARLLLCSQQEILKNFEQTNGSELNALLKAYDNISSSNLDNRHGITPIPIQLVDGNLIIDFDAFVLISTHLEEYSSEQQCYIDNFEFSLKLSKYSMTSYEVYKILRAIKTELSKNDENKFDIMPPPPLYTVLRQFIKSRINQTGNWHSAKARVGTKNNTNFDCELFSLASKLSDRFKKEEIIEDLFKEIRSKFSECINNDLFEMIFNEDLRFFAYSFGMESHLCIEVVQMAEDVRQTILIVMASDEVDRILSLNGLEAFDFLQNALFILDDQEFLRKLKNFQKGFTKKGSSTEKALILEEIFVDLERIIKAYKCESDCPMQKYAWDLVNDDNNVPKFGQIFIEATKKMSDAVNYDEENQMLTMPLEIAEKMMERIYCLVKKTHNLFCDIGKQLDFVKTMQSIALEAMPKLEGRRAIPLPINSQMFKLLLSFAIRLAVQSDTLARKYLHTFVSVFNCVGFSEYTNITNCLISFELKITNQTLQVQFPDWKIKENLSREYWDNLEIPEVKKSFGILLSLSFYSPTIYEVLKMTTKLGQINTDRIRIGPTDPKIFFILLTHLKRAEKCPAQTSCNKVEENEQSHGVSFSLIKRLTDQMEFLNCILLGEMEICDFLDELKMINAKNAHFAETERKTKKGIIEILIKNEFCVLTYFVADLLEQIMEKRGDLIEVESIGSVIGNFMATQQKMCSDKKKDEEIIKYFGENFLHYSKAIQINLNTTNDVQQIVPELIAELEKMLENKDWNYANLNYMKMAEWNLLEIEMAKMGQEKKWGQIDGLRAKWQTMFNEWYFICGEHQQQSAERILRKSCINWQKH